MKKQFRVLFVLLLVVGVASIAFMSISFINFNSQPRVETCQTICTTTVRDGYSFQSNPPKFLIKTESEDYYRLEQDNIVLRGQPEPSPDDPLRDRFTREFEAVSGPWLVSVFDFDVSSNEAEKSGHIILTYTGDTTPVELTVTASKLEIRGLVCLTILLGLMLTFIYAFIIYAFCMIPKVKLNRAGTSHHKKHLHGLQT